MSLAEAANEDVRMDSILGKIKDEDEAPAEKPAEQKPIEAKAEDKPEAKTEEAHTESAEGKPAADAAPAEKPASPEGDSHSEPSPAIAPPSSWKAELKDRWTNLPVDLQRDLAQWEDERNSGVNRKLSENAEQIRLAKEAQKAAEERATAVTAEQQRYAQQLGTIAQQMELLDPVIAQYQRTDLSKLAAENPAEYTRLDAAYKQRVGQITAIRNEQNRLQTEAMNAHFAREEQALISKWPELSNQEFGNKTLNDLRSGVVASYGFKPNEVQVISDHRYVMMARDALEAPKLRKEVETLKTQIAERDRSAKAEIQAKRVTPSKPVLKPNPSEETKDTQAKDRNKAILQKARSYRSLNDKASAIASMLED